MDFFKSILGCGCNPRGDLDPQLSPKKQSKTDIDSCNLVSEGKLKEVFNILITIRRKKNGKKQKKFKYEYKTTRETTSCRN